MESNQGSKPLHHHLYTLNWEITSRIVQKIYDWFTTNTEHNKCYDKNNQLKYIYRNTKRVFVLASIDADKGGYKQNSTNRLLLICWHLLFKTIYMIMVQDGELPREVWMYRLLQQTVELPVWFYQLTSGEIGNVPTSALSLQLSTLNLTFRNYCHGRKKMNITVLTCIGLHSRFLDLRMYLLI